MRPHSQLPGWLRLSMSAAVVGCLLTAGGSPVSGAGNTFTKIAEVATISTAAGLNSTGTVVFTVEIPPPPVTGVFTGTGGPVTTIADSSGPLGTTFLAAAINASGKVVFSASLDAGGQGVFVSDGSTTTLVADTSGAYLSFRAVSINDAGAVAFVARLDAGGEGVFVVDGALTTVIADTSDSTFAHFGDSVRINNSGQVGFSADLPGSQRGVFRSDGATITTIADTNGPTFDTVSVATDMNDAGTVLFGGNLKAGGFGIFTSAGTTLSTIADANDYVNMTIDGNFSINSSGQVAFQAIGPTGIGIFTGPDPVADKIIATGDPLFGSTVTNIPTGPFRGLNDTGQVAFVAQILAGPTVVVRADPMDTDSDGVPDTQDQCPDTAAGDPVNSAGCSASQLDTDGDGVLNAQDRCPNTASGDVVNGDGCSINQLVPCSGPWKNHGQYVSAIARVVNQFFADGLITDSNKGAIVRRAAMSNCGKK